MPASRTLTREDARRLAISRQHLDAAPRPALLDVIRDLGCVQLDPIRHVERTHRLVLWSRLGSQFKPAQLAHLRWQERALFEYWAHAASLVLTDEYPVHHYRMRLFQDPERSRWARSMQTWFDEHADVLHPLHDHILSELKNGPRLSREIDGATGLESTWYNGRFVPRVLDYLWSRGEVMVYGRPGNQRLWGLAEAFWPETTPQDVWPAAEVAAFAAQKAIRALGVATPTQIKRHYTRQVYPGLAKTLKGLVQAGTLEPVQILENGTPLKGEWYLHQADIPLLEQIQAGRWHGRTTLLSPFDNLICDRDRTEQLWDFFYRIEIYVPVKKREYGYYVLPILHQDRLIGRVDSKMDRKTHTWHIDNVYTEPDAPEDANTVGAIATAVADMAHFLGATAVRWGHLPPAWQALST